MCFPQKKNMLMLGHLLPHNKTLLRNVITVDVIGEDEVTLKKSEPIIYCD